MAVERAQTGARTRGGTPPRRARLPSSGRWREARAGYLFLLPSVVLLFVFVAGPALYAFYLSLFSWNLLNHMHFVGLSNFSGLWDLPLFWTAVGNTALFAGVVVPTQTLIALGIAALMNQHLPARGFFRLAFFFPAISSSAAISIIFMWIYNKFGILNSLLTSLHLYGPNWLANPVYALKAIMIMNIWTTSGYFMVVFLAGLQSIPRELYEAAAIDGAAAWQTFRAVTVPLLRPTTFFIVVMGVIGTLQMFDQSFILSQGTGGPLHSTTTIVLLVYQFIFSYGKVGFGAAATVLLFVFTLLATLGINRWLGTATEY